MYTRDERAALIGRGPPVPRPWLYSTAIRRQPWATVLCCALFLQSADAGAERPVNGDGAVATTIEAEYAGPSVISALIRPLIAGARDVSGHLVTAVERARLDALYGPGNYRPLWLDAAGRPGPLVRDALALLLHAPTEGLDPDDYDATRLTQLADALDRSARPPAADAAAFDVALSDRTLTYLRHLHSGRVDPAAVGFQMRLPVDHHDFPALLRDAIAGGRLAQAAADLTPPLMLYRDLRAALARYRMLAAAQTLAVLPTPSTSVRLGAPYTGLRALHHQLVVLGDLPAGAPPPIDAAPYDAAMVEGITRFQARHGLEPDGIIGARTFAALHVPLAWRVRQIELAMERLRWVPHLSESRGILVNIPMFRLWAWDSLSGGDAPSFATDVAVGRALNTPTPVFDEELRTLIFRPYWNVPTSIVRNEILPVLVGDPDYFERENMEIVSGPGDDAVPVPVSPDAIAQLRAGSLRLRQRPGPKNALGLVKFLFPNDNAVYLHDTPSAAVFSRSRRDASHGCVRVQDPIGLAVWAMREQPDWTRERIVAAMHGADSQRVQISTPIQMVLFYVTAAVTPGDATVRFAEDIYDRDAPLDRALANRLDSAR